MTAKTMHQGEAALRTTLTTLAEAYEEIVARAPRHPQWMHIDPLTPGQRAEHDRAIGYRNAARAIRDTLRTGQMPNDLTDNTELEQHGTPEETAS